MFDRILFPTDGSEGAKVAFDHVLDIVADNDATVHVLNVVDIARYGDTLGAESILEDAEREGDRIVEEAADRASARDADVVTDVRRGDPSRSITDYAEEYDVDLVVMPTHGRTGLERLLIGSVTDKVLRRADVPVLTLRPDRKLHPYPYREILLPTDGSRAAEAAVEQAIDLADAHDALLHVVYVVDSMALPGTTGTDEVYDSLETEGEDALESIRERAEAAGVEGVSASLLTGAPHEAIPEYAGDEEVDLIVMGTHGRRGVERYLLGSVTERVVRSSDRPVLTVRDVRGED